MKWLGAVLLVVVRDGVGLIGAGSIAYGAYQIYAPAGFIVGGILAMTASILVSRGN